MLDIMDLLETAKRKRLLLSTVENETLTIDWQLIGDSMHLQFLNGLQCGFYRHGLRSENTVIVDWSKQRHGVKGEWLYGPRANVTFEVFRNKAIESPETKEQRKRETKEILAMHRFTATRMYRTPRTLQDYPMQLTPLLTKTKAIETKSVGDEKVLPRESDLILLNFGLHWRWKEVSSYREHLRNLFSIIQTVSRQYPEKIFVWRESSAQHHIGIGGEFSIAPVSETIFSSSLSSQEYKRFFVKCSDQRTMRQNVFNETLFVRKWREVAVLEMAKEVGLNVIDLKMVLTENERDRQSDRYGDRDKSRDEGKEGKGGRMFILPFYDYTERFGNMHPYKPNRENTFETEIWRDPVTNETATYRTCDPTHFCYSPLFWEPVIDALAEIVLYATRS
jgi:hypothetical protein